MTVLKAVLYLLILLVRLSAAFSEDLSGEGSPADDNLGTHGFAQSGDVRIHYVTKGEGPLLVMILLPWRTRR